MTLVTDPNPGLVGPEIDTTVIPNWVAPRSPISTVSRETLDGVSDTFERQLMVAGKNEPCRVTYGTDRIGGQLLDVLNYGTSILVSVVWGRGPIQAIRQVTVDNVTPPAAVLITNYLGTTSQTVNAKLVSAYAALGITHTDALLGIAYSVFEFPVGTDVGDIAATIDGRLIYDARDGTQTLGVPSTYKWSDVPGVVLADLVADTTYGWGRTRDVTSTNAVANANDAVVSGERKRIIGLTIDSRKKAEEWVEILRAHAGCYVVHSGASTKFVPDATASSIKTYSKANKNIIAGSVQWAMRDVDQQPNVVQITYTDTRKVPWETATTIYPTDGLPPVGEELRMSRLSLTGNQRHSQGTREAIETVNHASLEALQQSWDTYAESVGIEPGDVVTFDDGGLSGGILMRVLARQWVKKGRWRIVAQKYDPAAFDSSAVAAPSSANTTLPSAGTPPTVASLTLTEEAVSVAAGALPLSKIRATWPGVSYPFFLGYKVVIKNAAGVTVDEGTTTGTTYLSAALNAFTTYTVTVQVYSSVAIGATMTGTITLVSLGIDALATVWSEAITSSAGWSFTNVETYQLWPGDTALRFRTLAANERVETAYYTGPDQSTPGLLSQMLDAKYATFSSPATLPIATSPVYDIGVSRTCVAALYNLAKWTNIYQGVGASDAVGTGSETLTAFSIVMSLSDSVTMTPSTSAYGTRVTGVGRYAQFVVQSLRRSSGVGFVVARTWALEFDPGGIAALMPTVSDTLSATSSASGGVTVTLPRKYITVTSVQITAESVSQANPSYSNLTLSETLDNTLVLHCYDTTNARIAVPCSISITGVAV